jgi:hypothetical protein
MDTTTRGSGCARTVAGVALAPQYASLGFLARHACVTSVLTGDARDEVLDAPPMAAARACLTSFFVKLADYNPRVAAAGFGRRGLVGCGMNKPEVASDPVPQRLFEIVDLRPPGPVSMLRGARIEIDGARVGRVLIAAVLAALAACSVAFFVVGAHKNAQINELRHHGVPVVLTVTKCSGLMGGSGSNLAGYACTGMFHFNGRNFDEPIPGSAEYAPATKLAVVTAANGSGLFAPIGVLAGERSSWKVFILPMALALAFAVLASTLALRRRHARPRGKGSPARRVGRISA